VVAVLATIGAVVVVVARVLARRQQPPPPAAADWPPLAREPATHTPAAATAESHVEPKVEPHVDPKVESKPAPVAESPPKVEPEPAADGWVDADDGACPTSHPVKAKLSSGIYHVPGGLNYERTKADRCYATPDAAEVDGLRASKR
jgi:hypothetical protein